MAIAPDASGLQGPYSKRPRIYTDPTLAGGVLTPAFRVNADANNPVPETSSLARFSIGMIVIILFEGSNIRRFREKIAQVNASLIRLPITATYITLSGSVLFVVSNFGMVDVYNATTGAPINASLISGLSSFTDIVAVDGSDLFVLTSGGPTLIQRVPV